jgi:membrane-associated phospholipid phosphatase
MLVDTLITSRDGIVGHWNPPKTTPSPLEVEDKANLQLWGPRERTSLCHFELLSRLCFEKAGEGVKVQHIERGNGQYWPLVTIVRPTPEIFGRQLDYLDRYADLRADRAAEILAQLGHPTPFLASIAFLDSERTRWTLELLYVAIELAYYVVMRVKHGLACRRPHEYSPQVQPMIPVPLHGTFPSGHATEATMAAFVLWKVISQGKEDTNTYADSSWCDQLMAQAARIAINRTVAGLHFPVDSAAGTVLGLTLGDYFVSRCRNGPYQAWEFDGSQWPDRDFFRQDFFNTKEGSQETDKELKLAVKSQADPVNLGHSDILKWLWDKAVEEWPPPKQSSTNENLNTISTVPPSSGIRWGKRAIKTMCSALFLLFTPTVTKFLILIGVK